MGKASYIDVLFEDNHLIAVNKPAGILVQADVSRDPSLEAALKEYIKDKYNKPGSVFLGTIHRLDRPVTGVVLFARTSKALERMNELFRSRQVEKKYWAIVKDLPDALEDHLTHWIKKDEEKNKSRAFNKDTLGAQKCELSYKYLGSSNTFHLLEVTPHTGRHHQIRTQLSKIGAPIKGDLKYGFPRSNEDGSICLHARSLRFIHPVTKEEIFILANPPKDPVWNFFLESQKNNEPT